MLWKPGRGAGADDLAAVVERRCRANRAAESAEIDRREKRRRRYRPSARCEASKHNGEQNGE
jgi:hypothetical protein